MDQKSELKFKAWAHKIRRSDQQAFNELFRWTYARLVKFSASYTGEKSSASDVVQETFIVLWQTRKKIDPDKSLNAYLYRIVRNRSLNYIRDHSHTIVHTEMAHSEYSSRHSTSGMDEYNTQNNLDEMFSRWIQNLSARQKEAFELSRFEGFNHNEIAIIMGISSKTVNNHIVTALQQLRSEYNLYNKKIKEQDR